MTAKCSATTKQGKPCTWPAVVNGLCCAHDPEQRATLAERGRAGQRRKKEHAERRRQATCSLRTCEDLLTELERAIVEVDFGAGGDLIQRAKAKCSIIEAAHRVLRAERLESENKELRDLLLERHPDLKRHLKSI